MPAKISDEPSQVLIDQVSLKSFVDSSKLLKEINKEIATKKNGSILEHQYHDVLKEVTHVGLKTIADIELALKAHKQDIVAFAVEWLTDGARVVPTIGLFYLCYVLIGQTMSVEKALDYVVTAKISSSEPDGQTQEEIAEDILATYKRISSHRS